MFCIMEQIIKMLLKYVMKKEQDVRGYSVQMIHD